MSEKIRWFDELTFIEPGGRASRMAPSFLPAPMHNMPAFLRAKMLSVKDKLAIARAMAEMSRASAGGFRRKFSLLAEAEQADGAGDRAVLEDRSGERVE